MTKENKQQTRHISYYRRKVHAYFQRQAWTGKDVYSENCAFTAFQVTIAYFLANKEEMCVQIIRQFSNRLCRTRYVN